MWVIFFYCIFDFLIDPVQWGTAWGKEHRFQIYSLFEVIEFLFFACFVYLSVERGIMKRVTLGFSALVVLSLVFAYTKANPKNFDSILACIESIGIITISITYFYEQISRPVSASEFIYASPKFWVVLAFLIYSSGTLFLFILSFNLPHEQMLKYWFINNLFNICTSVLLSVSFLVSRFASKHPPPEKAFPDYSDILEKP